VSRPAVARSAEPGTTERRTTEALGRATPFLPIVIPVFAMHGRMRAFVIAAVHVAMVLAPMLHTVRAPVAVVMLPMHGLVRPRVMVPVGIAVFCSARLLVVIAPVRVPPLRMFPVHVVRMFPVTVRRTMDLRTIISIPGCHRPPPSKGRSRSTAKAWATRESSPHPLHQVAVRPLELPPRNRSISIGINPVKDRADVRRSSRAAFMPGGASGAALMAGRASGAAVVFVTRAVSAPFLPRWAARATVAPPWSSRRLGDRHGRQQTAQAQRAERSPIQAQHDSPSGLKSENRRQRWSAHSPPRDVLPGPGPASVVASDCSQPVAGVIKRTLTRVVYTRA
jgi:hypothetical protein